MRKLKLLTLLAALCCSMMLWAADEGPWTRMAYKTGQTGLNATTSSSFNNLNGNHWAVVNAWNDNDGIGYIISNGSSVGNTKTGVFSVYERQESVPSYTRKVLTWTFQVGSCCKIHYSNTCLYALYGPSNDLKNITVDFTYNYSNGAGSGYRAGRYTNTTLDNQGHFTNSTTWDMGFDNRNGTSQVTKYWSLMLTHVVGSGGSVSGLHEWGSFKSISESWATYYYKYVSFNANGGSGSMGGITVENSATLPNNAFSRTGYTFAGWSTTQNGSQAYANKGTITATSSSKGPVTLYARWSGNKYTVTLNQQSGSGGTGNVQATYGSSMPSMTRPSRAGYTFQGYYTQTGGKGTKYYNASGSSAKNWDITSNTTLYAYWTLDTYSITCNLNGGSLSSANPSSYNVTSNTFTLNNPTRTGYTFAGWTGSNGSTSQTSVSIANGSTGNKTYTANWTPINYSVTYTLNDGAVETENPTTYNIETATFTLNNPTRTGYTFAGWTGSNGTTAQTSVSVTQGSTGNKSYTANWTANKYTVTFDMQEGAGGSEQVQATSGSAMPSITLPTRVGYTFGGYYTQIGGNGTKYYNADGTSAANWNITSATTLYAKWTANKYTVILDMQGGTGGLEQVQATYNAAMPSITVPTLSEYEFKGYYSEPNGGGTLYYNTDGSSAATYTLTAGTSLYAKWQSLWGDDLTVVEDTDPTTYTPTQIVNGGFESNPNSNPYYSNNAEYEIGQGWMTSENETDGEGNYFEWLSSQIAQWSCGNSVSGYHSVEMNAQNSAVLYQDLTTTELDVIRWSLKHGARENYGPTKQSMRVEVGAPQMNNNGEIELAFGVNDYIDAYIEESTMAIYTHNGISGNNGYDGENLAKLMLDKEGQCDQWYTVKGVYIIPEGQTITRFAFIADSEADQNGAPAKRTFEERKAAAMAKAAARKTKLDEEECYECWCEPSFCDPDELCDYWDVCGGDEEEEESDWGILSGGNFLDDVDFATLIGNLSAVYNDDGTVTIRGYWGEEDTSKKLIVKIGSTMHNADMSSVLHKNFKISVSKAYIGTNTYLEVYHQSYETAKRVLEIDHTTTLADNMDTTEWTVSPAYATTGSTVTLTYTGLENIGTITAINNADEEQSVTLTTTSTPNQWTFTMPDYNVHFDCEILPPTNEANGECGAQGDNLLWTYYSNGVLEITGTGAMADYEVSTTDYPWVDYKTTIHTVSLPDGETTIGKDAFKGLSNLTTVTLPSALTTISENAFYGCPITSMTIPSTVVTIGASAFNSCSNLTAITMLTETPPALGTNAFSNCSSTLTITVPSCDAVIAYGSAANWSALANKIVSATGECPASVSDQQTATVINTTLQELIDNGSTEDDLTIVRPVYKNTYYNTLCFPFSMTAAQIAASPLAGATIKECTGAQVVNNELQIVFSDVTAIVAGEPYFVSYENADALTQMDFENVDVTTLTAGASETYNGVTFKGTFVPFAMPAQTANSYSYLFLGQNNTLFWPNVANNLKPFRCYFEINTGSNAPVRRGMNARIVEEQQNATGVENVERGETSIQKVLRNGQLFIIRDGVEYNAQGQMVQ